MRKRIKPVVLLVFFISFISFLVLSRTIADLQARERQETTKTIPNSNTPRKTTTASSSSKKEEDINPELVGRPIIDISGWQLPSEIDYDVLSQNVGGVIVRVHSGAQAKKENAATYLNGLDKSFKTHIQEFQKRNIPVAVYAYVAAKDKKEMEKEFVFKKGSVVVETNKGKVRGYAYNGVSVFKGIPYAKAKRFHAPEPLEAWEGELDATSFGYVCPLLDMPKPAGEVFVPHRYWVMDEDCLNLNIWTPSCDEKKRPVLVWFHGGGFEAGSSIEHIAYELSLIHI